MEDIEDQLLWCSLCETEYDAQAHEPKLLSCHHSFCLACLLKMDASKPDKPVLRCPTCKKKTSIPGKGIKALPTNIYVAKMKQILQGAAKARSGSQNSVKSGNGISTSTVAMVAPTSTSNAPITTQGCAKHSNQPLLFYCESCMVPICMNCTVLEHDKLAGHVIKDIQSAFVVHSEIIEDKLDKLQTAIERRAFFVQLLHAEAGNINAARETSLRQLDQTFMQLEEKLKQRKEVLLEEMNTLYSRGKETLQNKMAEVKREVESMREIQQRCTKSLEIRDPADILRVTTDTQAMSEIDQFIFKSSLQGIGPNFIKFDYNTGLYDFVSTLNQLGKFSMDTFLPSNVNMKIHKAKSSMPSQISVKIGRVDGQELKAAVPITAVITDPCNDELQCKVLHEKGLYTLKYRPQMPGTYEICLQFLGQTIKGTQQTFTVASNDPIMKIGSEGSELGQLLHPTAVAIASNDDIYVADMGNKRIQIFDSSGTYKDKITISKKVNTVYDITLNNATDELIFSKVVPNESTGKPEANNIYVCDLKGTKKHSFSNPDMRNALFTAVNSKGWIIATDMMDNKVYIYSKEGR